jgi:hypothetical protein
VQTKAYGNLGALQRRAYCLVEIPVNEIFVGVDAAWVCARTKYAAAVAVSAAAILGNTPVVVAASAAGA